MKFYFSLAVAITTKSEFFISVNNPKKAYLELMLKVSLMKKFNEN